VNSLHLKQLNRKRYDRIKDYKLNFIFMLIDIKSQLYCKIAFIVVRKIIILV